MNKLPALNIGGLIIDPPFILGGMGASITTHPLVAAVADCGIAGTIASVGLSGSGYRGKKFVKQCNISLVKEIQEARKLTKGIIGVNVMVALTNYDELVKTAVSQDIDYIISGAGLPLNLPEHCKDSKAKLIPIVSSGRAANLIYNKWKTKFDRTPDAVVVEGPKAGGHLGYKYDDIKSGNVMSLQDICKEVIEVAAKWEEEDGKHIPVIAAGGVFDGKDIAEMFELGVEGVQLGTRFIATHECAVPDEFKQKIIDAKEEDIVIVKSPVGMPGRAIRNGFVDKVNAGEKMPVDCFWHCLKTCNPKTAPFCIANALFSAVEGRIEEALVFSGANAHRINEIVHVKDLIEELENVAFAHMSKKNGTSKSGDSVEVIKATKVERA